MADERFPEIVELPKQQWVQGLSESSRAVYEETRTKDIALDVEKMIDLIRSLSDFDGVSDEAVGWLVLRVAPRLRDCYEEGIQVGSDNVIRRRTEEDERKNSFIRNHVGYWAR